jgi:hypothetical protein
MFPDLQLSSCYSPSHPILRNFACRHINNRRLTHRCIALAREEHSSYDLQHCAVTFAWHCCVKTFIEWPSLYYCSPSLDKRTGMEVFKLVILGHSLAYIHALSPHFCALTFEQHVSLIKTNPGTPKLSPDPVLPRHCGYSIGRCVTIYHSSAYLMMLSLRGRNTLAHEILYLIPPRSYG